MKSKKSSKFKFSFSSTPVSSHSSSSSLSASLRKDSIASEKKSDVTLLSVKRKASSDDSGWESSTPSTSSSSTSSRKSSPSSNFFKLFHRSAATLLLPRRCESDFESLPLHRPSRTNVFIKNEELDLDSLPASNKQTSFVTKARRRSSKLQARSLSAVNLVNKRAYEEDYEEEGSSVISGCTSSTLTSSSLSPLRRHSVSSLLSSRYESAKESLEYDSGAYSRTSSPEDSKYLVTRASSSHLAISAPLSAPSLVLAACSGFSGSPRLSGNCYGPEDDTHRVSVSIGAHTRLSVSNRGRCPLLGTAGLSPGKRGSSQKTFLSKSSLSPNRLTRSKISTVYLGKTPKKPTTTSLCNCGEQVTVNGRHHCSGDQSCFSDEADSEVIPI